MSGPGRGVRRRLREGLAQVSRSLFADAAWGSAFEVVLLLGSLATFVVLSRQLGRAEFGRYSAIQGLVVVLATFANSWIAFVLLQELRRDGGDPSRVLPSLLSWSIVGSLATGGAAVLVRWAFLPQLPAAATLAFVAAEVVGNAVMSLAVTLSQAVEGYAASARWRIGLEVLQAVVLLGTWVAGYLTLLTAGVGLLLVNTVVGAVTLARTVRRCGLRLRPGRPRASHLRTGSLYMLVLSCFAVEEDADKTLLVHFGLGVTAGAYAAAYRIVQIGLVPLRAMVASMHNRFLRHDPDAIGEHLGRSLRFTAPSGAYGALVTAGLVLGAPLVPAVLGRGYADTVPMIRALAVLVLMRSLTVFAFNGLMGLGRNGYRTTVLCLAAATNVAVNVTLIPAWSWRAAAAATAAGEIVYLGGTWGGLVVLQRRHDAAVRARRGSTGLPRHPRRVGERAQRATSPEA